MNLSIVGASATHVGKRRDHNEDACLWLPEQAIAVVADGMGGHEGGEVASAMVIDGVREGAARGMTAEQSLEAAHQRLRGDYAGQSTRPPGATVIVTSFLSNRQLRFSWAGDCRLYRCRNGSVTVLSRDHSMVDELFRAGALTAEEARVHPQRNVVSRAIGLPDHVHARLETEITAVEPGDRYLLCSDGLHGFLSEARLAEILRDAPSATAVVEGLMIATLQETEAGDNLTAACCIAGPVG